MGSINLPFEAHVQTGPHALVMPTRKCEKGYRVHLWGAESEVQGAAAPFALYGEGLEYVSAACCRLLPLAALGFVHVILQVQS